MKNSKSRSIAAVVMALVLWIGLTGSPAVFAQLTQYNIHCFGCHLAPTGARVNAAAAAAVITSADTRHGMGLGALAIAQIPTIAAEIDADLGGVAGRTQSIVVNYQSILNPVSIATIVLNDPLDPGGAVITSLAQSMAPSRGDLAGSTATSINYRHTASNCSADSFQVIGQGFADTAPRTVNVTITAPAAPTATGATTSGVVFNTATNIPLTLGGGPILSLSVTTPPANGAVTVTGPTTVSYTSSSTAYVPSVTFQYRANGPCANSAIVMQTININAPAPTAPNVTTTANFNPGGAAATPISLAGPISGAVTGVMITSGPATGLATVTGTTVNYTPAAGNLVTDTFQYQTTGPGGTSTTGAVTVNIAPPGAPTVTTPITTAVLFNPGGAGATAIALAGFITGAVSNITITTPPTRGTFTVTGATVNYTPNPGNLTADSFQFTATAPGGATSGIATVNINITPPGPPVITTPINLMAPFNAGGAGSSALSLAAFITGPVSSIAVTLAPTRGTVTVTGTTLNYTPNAGNLTADSLQFTATAPGGATSAAATVNIAITPPPPPAVAAKSVSAVFNTPSMIDLASSISGVFSGIAVATPPAHGTTSVSGTVVTYTPAAGYSGPDSFTYTATAPGGATSAPATVTINVVRATASPVTLTTQFNTPKTLDLTSSVTGVGITGIQIVSAPAHGTATVSGMKVTYTPVNNYFGSDEFSYIAFGTGGSSLPAKVSVSVEGRPDPTQQPNVVGMVIAQVQAIQRYGQTQIANIGRHAERLRRGGGAVDSARTQGQAPVAATPAVVDPFADVPEKDKASPSRASSADAIARSTSGSASRNEAMSAQPGRSAMRGAFGVPAAAGPGDGVEARFQSLAQVASATAVSATQTDAAPLRVNGGGLAADLISVLTSRSVNLAQLSGGGAGAQPANVIGGTDFWIEGSVNFGNRGTAAGGGSIDFSTSGLTLGIDWRLSNQLVVGVGAGFARDRTDVGVDGTKSVAKGASLAVYGSYQPSANTFVDALAGAGTLNFDTERFVAPINAFAKSDRDGSQIFASVAAGYEFKHGEMLLSPYARLDLSYDRLKGGAETGVGNFALHYFGERMRSTHGALGLRLESVHETSFGWLAPRARIELRHSFDGDHVSQIAYADQIGGPRYSISTAAVERNALVAGIGGDFYLRSGLSLGVDYQLQKSFPTGSGSSQGIRLRLTQALDGKGVRPPPIVRAIEAGGAPHHDSSDIRIDAGITYDDNVTRGRLATETLRDTSVNLAVNKVELFPFTDNIRLMVVGSVGGDKFHSYNGLDRLFASVRGELQYRASADFGSPILAAFGRFAGEQFESQLRRGYRASAGVSVRVPVTDRILLFGALAHNERYAKSSVFDSRDNALQLNVDYALGNDSTLYLAGEYRRGDVVSTGLGSLENIDIAKVFVADDAFPGRMFAYKVDASTGILTLGYNLSFGTRDSLDFSWRRARSTPSARPGFNAPGPFRYEADQFSVVYLVRF